MLAGLRSLSPSLLRSGGRSSPLSFLAREFEKAEEVPEEFGESRDSSGSSLGARDLVSDSPFRSGIESILMGGSPGIGHAALASLASSLFEGRSHRSGSGQRTRKEVPEEFGRWTLARRRRRLERRRSPWPAADGDRRDANGERRAADEHWRPAMGIGEPPIGIGRAPMA
jgi:hypothetical protein